MRSITDLLLETDYQDIPLGVRHEVLGEAAFYLDMVLHTSTIPGMDEYVVVPYMLSWCELVPSYRSHRYPDRTGVLACLGGIWYTCTTGKLLEYTELDVSNILIYLEKVVTCTRVQVTELVGLDKPFQRAPNHDGWVIENVRDTLHSLAYLIPTMMTSYQYTAISMGYVNGVPEGLVVTKDNAIANARALMSLIGESKGLCP